MHARLFIWQNFLARTKIHAYDSKIIFVLFYQLFHH